MSRRRARSPMRLAERRSGCPRAGLAQWRRRGGARRRRRGAQCAAGLPIGDIDIATTALPEEVIRRAEAAGIKSVPTGIEHGTVMLVATASRSKSRRCARTSRPMAARPGSHSAATGSAMPSGATSPSTDCRSDAEGSVHDHVGGLDDLAARRVRFIGDPAIAHRRRLSAHAALFPHPCRIWRRRAGSRRPPRLHRRPRGLGERCRPSACARKC